MVISPLLTDPWQELVGLCADEVLRAPKTWGDQLRSSDMKVPPNMSGTVTYLKRNVVGHPWANHLTLLVAVLYSQNVQFKTVLGTMSSLHRGFSSIFPALNLQSMADWDVDKHLALYLGSQVLESHSASKRVEFWRHYQAGSRHLKRWIAGIPEGQQSQYHQYLLHVPSDPREFSILCGLNNVRLEQQEKRKADTDALMPFYMDLRTQAHLRYNLLVRIRKAYQAAIKAVENEKVPLPFEFELREGGNERLKQRVTERLMFKLWDRRTFLRDHEEAFSWTTKWFARNKEGAYTDEKNSYLLEFVGVEALDGETQVRGLWFLELLQRDVLGDFHKGRPQEEIIPKLAWLKEQGYVEEDEDERRVVPFRARTPGLLHPSKTSGDGATMYQFRKQTGCIFLPVESLYAAATFGMVALHILTANGMRISELLQLRASAECIVPIVLPPAPDAENQAPTVHWEARAVPKGHRTAKSYYFDDEHLRLLSLIKFMLCEHYGIDPKSGGDLPVVTMRSLDEHRFDPDRYLFQYNKQALHPIDVRVSMRFLIHGLVFQTLDGRRVTVLPHLLRHGFATWALNIAKEPVDIVAAILNQKNFAVTKYYGRPNPRLIAERSHGLMNQISSYIDVEELILRSPEEIRQMLLKAQKTHGTLARVRGGRCLLCGECPILFACIGCAAKAPDPTQRGEVEETRQITLIQIGKTRKKGLTLEVLQHEKKLKQCDAELREMDMIELCREDEKRAPEVNFDVNA